MRVVLKILFIFTLTILQSKANINSFQNQVLRGLDIPISFSNTSYFKDMKNSIKRSHIDDFTRIIRGGYRYIPTVKNILKGSGVPDTLFFLAMVESGFSNKVVSNASATGIWQFMKTTAQVHGLKIDKYVDERRDPVKSTKAAVAYLKKLKDQFGKWYLAILAYNAGDGKLRKAIKEAGTDDLATLLDPQKKYLPEETRRFIIKILRGSLISKDSEFALSKDAYILHQAGLKMARVSVPGGTTLKKVSDSIGVGIKRLKEYNAHLNFVFTPPNLSSYHIYIPENKKSIFASNFNPIKSNNRFYTHTVKKGETLLSISKNSGVSHKAIKEYNDLANSKLAVNQKLIIPRSDKNKIQKYVVQNGDTFDILSEKFNVSIKDIKEANTLAKSDILMVGDSIVIP